LAVDFDAPGRLNMHAIRELGVPRDADFYLCGPLARMNDLAVELGTWGVAANRIHTEIFGSSPSRTPASRRHLAGHRTSRQGLPAWDHWCPLHGAAKCPLGPGLPEPPRTC
jgi:ferredoxin-NADP reductase